MVTSNSLQTYTIPTLKIYGSVAELTNGGSAGATEQMKDSTNMMKARP